MSEVISCVVIGGGGHAKVVLDILLTAASAGSLAILDSDASLHGKCLLGVKIAGDDGTLDGLIRQGARRFTMGVGGAGNNRPRARLYAMAAGKGLEPVKLSHHSSVISPHAEVAPGAQVFPGAIVNAGARVGANVIVNSRAIVEHDTVVDDHAHIAPGACVCAGVRIGEGSHIGAGAVIRQGMRIGAWSVIGAGAIVVHDVQDGVTVAGNPARPL